MGLVLRGSILRVDMTAHVIVTCQWHLKQKQTSVESVMGRFAVAIQGHVPLWRCHWHSLYFLEIQPAQLKIERPEVIIARYH